jgi:hypothetical protein
MALKKERDHKISRINRDMMEDGRLGRKKGMERFIILMEAILKGIFRITKSTVKESIIGSARVFIKGIGFIIRSVELDR